MQPFDLAATTGEGKETARRTGRQAEGVRHGLCVEPVQCADRRRRAKDAAGSGGVETAPAQARLCRRGDPRGHLIAGRHPGEHLGAAGAQFIGRGEGGGHHHAARMHRAGAVTVVEFQAVARDAAQIGGGRGIGAAPPPRHRHGPLRQALGEHRLGRVRDGLSTAGQAGAKSIEDVTLGRMPGLGIEIAVIQGGGKVGEPPRRAPPGIVSNRRWVHNVTPPPHPRMRAPFGSNRGSDISVAGLSSPRISISKRAPSSIMATGTKPSATDFFT